MRGGKEKKKRRKEEKNKEERRTDGSSRLLRGDADGVAEGEDDGLLEGDDDGLAEGDAEAPWGGAIFLGVLGIGQFIKKLVRISNQLLPSIAGQISYS